MTFTQFLLILKARFWIILITFLVIVSAATVVSLLMPKSYTATTSLVLNYKGMDPVTGTVLPAQLMPGYMATQIDIISSQNVAIKVVDALKFTDSSVAQEQFYKATQGKGDIRAWFADQLLKELDVKPSKESSVLEISFKGADPEFAAEVVNGFANAYIQTNLQLKVEPSQKAASFLGEQTKALRENLEIAQAKISKYQQQKGLTNIVGSLDVESARLNDLSSQLVMAQSQAYESNSRQRSAGGNGLASPDVTANSVIQNMKIEISRVESKLSELSQRVGVNHPQYQATKEELDKLKSMLRQETQNVSSSVAGTANIYRQREAELKASLAAQKARVLELNLSRDELAVLQRDVENAQRAMDAASQRYTQATLEGKANQSDVAVLNPATAPQTQSSPKVFRNILLATFLGTMLGVCFALLVELTNRRVRSRDDLSELLEVPVFTISSASQNSPKYLFEMPRLLLKAK
jgi:succinoglycan biosynthesis transport protein ExoP